VCGKGREAAAGPEGFLVGVPVENQVGREGGGDELACLVE
jgi:hypothetical protein